MKKTHDYVHFYRGYWSEGGRCRIRIYREEGKPPMVVCSQLPDNDNTSVTNMAEYPAAEGIEDHELSTPLTWLRLYPEHERGVEEWSLVKLSPWEREEVCVGGYGAIGSARRSDHCYVQRSNSPNGAAVDSAGFVILTICEHVCKMCLHS